MSTNMIRNSTLDKEKGYTKILLDLEKASIIYRVGKPTENSWLEVLLSRAVPSRLKI
jgi:hypothetical protein